MIARVQQPVAITGPVRGPSLMWREENNVEFEEWLEDVRIEACDTLLVIPHITRTFSAPYNLGTLRRDITSLA